MCGIWIQTLHSPRIYYLDHESMWLLMESIIYHLAFIYLNLLMDVTGIRHGMVTPFPGSKHSPGLLQCLFQLILTCYFVLRVK